MPVMDEQADRVARGRATYARNFGVGEEEAEERMADVAGLTFTREAFLAAGGPGWQSLALTDRDRSLAVIAALVGQHVTDERLDVYLAVARRHGVGEEGLEALMVLLASYVGQPATSGGAAAVRRTRPEPNA